MDDVWRRVEAELRARKRGPAWLAQRLDCSVQRIVNWKARGVPRAAYPEVASALGWTIDRVAGVEEPALSAGDLSPMARKLAEMFDAISDDGAQLRAYTACVALIVRATDESAAPPTVQPARKPTV